MEKLIPSDDGLLLWSESFGQPGDRPLLLIMGAMNQGIFWPDDFCRRLAAAGFYVIRYDHRDTGRSSVVNFATAPYDLAALSRDALAVLRGHGIARALVVGLSMGGYIAQLMALDDPAAVEALVLISSSADQRPYMTATMGLPASDSPLPGPEGSWLAYLRAMQVDPPRSAEAMTENILRGWEITYGGERPFPRQQVAAMVRLAAQRTSQPMAAFQHGLAVAASPHRLQRVHDIRQPTLVIHGRFDACLPLPHGEDLARRIPGAKLCLLPMGHSFMFAWDDEVLAAILAFACP